ncbi:MAG: hypothetical protein IPL53_21985 [Ignavibacteria bacterium]|nr:hypothetical protein [Ignavibacteria bacterium]
MAPKGLLRQLQKLLKKFMVQSPLCMITNLKDRVTFIINDVSDIANGATDYFGNRIEIYASGMDYDLRGYTQLATECCDSRVYSRYPGTGHL